MRKIVAFILFALAIKSLLFAGYQSTQPSPVDVVGVALHGAFIMMWAFLSALFLIIGLLLLLWRVRWARYVLLTILILPIAIFGGFQLFNFLLEMHYQNYEQRQEEKVATYR